MKKTLFTLILIFTLLITVSCANSEKANENSNNFFDNETNIMSYQTLSSIKLLELNENNITKRRLPNNNDVTEKNDIEKYIQMMEELLNGNHGFKIAPKTSDKENYTNFIEIKTSNFYNEEIVYSLYYNEETYSEEVDEDKIEIVKIIKGIAISNGKEFTLEGKITEEKENDEVETESVYKIIEDKDNYVIVSLEKEDEDNEIEHDYKYVVVKNGKKVNELKFEFEQEKEEISIKLTETNNNEKKSYKFKCIEENNIKYIKIEVREGTSKKIIKVRMIYDTEKNKYSYDYKYVKEK